MRSRPRSGASAALFLTAQMWQALGARVREAATHPEILCTVVTGSGTFYSAGANVKAAGSVFATAAEGNDPTELRATFMKRLAAGNADVARAMYEHPKLLVAALNGPAIGLSAGLLGYFVRPEAHAVLSGQDFIYAVEDAYVMTPFTSLGLTAEGGSSQVRCCRDDAADWLQTFVARMGPRAAKEALIFVRCLQRDDLTRAGQEDDRPGPAQLWLHQVRRALIDAD